MCDPVTIALTAVSAVGTLAGGMVQAQGIQQQAEAEARSEERRAELAERQKEVNQTQASYERKNVMDRLRRVQGQNRAVGAERGLSESGSLVDVMDDSEYEAGKELDAIRYGAEGERGNLTFEANTARERAHSARQAGKTAAFGAALGGFTGAFSTIGGSWYQRPLKN